MLGKRSVVNGCEFLIENCSFRLKVNIKWWKFNGSNELKPVSQPSIKSWLIIF